MSYHAVSNKIYQKEGLTNLNTGSRPKNVTKVMKEMANIIANSVPRGPMLANPPGKSTVFEDDKAHSWMSISKSYSSTMVEIAMLVTKKYAGSKR